MENIDEFFRQDNGLYVFSTHLYSASLSLLYLKVRAQDEMFYIGFGPTLYHAGVMHWQGKKFYEAPQEDLRDFMTRSPHLASYFQGRFPYRLFVFPSDTDKVLIAAAGFSLIREKPKVWVKFGGSGE